MYEIKIEGSSYLHASYYDTNGNLHFCKVGKSLDGKELTIDIESCGEFEHLHTILTVKLWKSKPYEVRLLQMTWISDELLKKIVSYVIENL